MLHRNDIKLAARSKWRPAAFRHPGQSMNWKPALSRATTTDRRSPWSVARRSRPTISKKSLERDEARGITVNAAGAVYKPALRVAALWCSPSPDTTTSHYKLTDVEVLSGNFAILSAIRRASSLVSSLAAEGKKNLRRP